MGKKSISVPELQRMLGLKKGAAYWLIKQGHFETVIVGNKMRVMLDSFEEWIAQRAVLETTYSATEVAAMLGVHRNTVYNLIASGLFKTERYNDRPRIDKESFIRWYRGQKRYHIPAFEKEA